MKWHHGISVCLLLLALAACNSPQREARRMVKRAERLADTLPDSTAQLIGRVLRMPVSFSERERMDMALLQAEALMGDHGQEVSPMMDDDFFDDHVFLTTSPELERAADYYARKKQYDKAARAALYSGFVQQHYDEKETAMQSFKDAEQYGKLANDSLTVAQAQYRMEGMLYDEGRYKEALKLLETAKKGFGDRYVNCARVLNRMACCYMLTGENDSAMLCLDQGLDYADRGHSPRTRRKLLNNYAVLYRIQGKYDQAITCHTQIAHEGHLTDKEQTLHNLNLGKAFAEIGEMDSAALYYGRLEQLLPDAKVKAETKVSAYDALSRFAKSQGNDSLALAYREKHEIALYEVMEQRQEQNILRIQQQYDYESLQNVMNQKIIQRHRIIMVISVVAILGLTAFALSRVRLAKTRKEEAEAKANLFHFMQQNKELTQQHETHEKTLTDLSMTNEANLKAYHDLVQKYEETRKLCEDYARKLSDALNKEALIIRKMDLYSRNKGDQACWVMLNEAVFEGDDPWEALMKVFDTLYPGLRENLKQQHPDLTEMEQKDFILSYFNVSRDDEALMFQKSVHSVDKWRNSVRKKMQAQGQKTS